MQADEPVDIPKGSFDKVMAMKDRENAAPSATENAADAKCAEVRGFTFFIIQKLIILPMMVVFCSSNHIVTPGPQNKAHFRRFMDSVLQKTTKLKSLLKDLTSNYQAETAKQLLNRTSK